MDGSREKMIYKSAPIVDHSLVPSIQVVAVICSRSLIEAFVDRHASQSLSMSALSAETESRDLSTEHGFARFTAQKMVSAPAIVCVRASLTEPVCPGKKYSSCAVGSSQMCTV